jgi:hypothetical protein
LLHDTTGEADKKLRGWEKSAKLKAAEATVSYYTRKGKNLPSEHRHQREFIDREGSSIKSDRFSFWGQTTHPNRWTNRSLETDVQEADKLDALELEEIYQVEYRRMNWFAHGSGLTGIRDFSANSFFDLCGLAFGSCQKLAMMISKSALKAYGYFQELDIYDKRWDEINRKIMLHIKDFLPEEPQA